MTREAEVVVVGVGLAGLTAARALVAAGRDVVVVEARDRVGGRTLNHHLGDGKVVEVGGQWIGPTQDRIAALASELGVETFPTFTHGDNILVLGGKTHRYSGEFPPLDNDAATDILNAMIKLQTMADTVPLDAPWTAADADAWDSQTFRTFVEDNAKDPVARSMFELLSGAIFTSNSAELSLFHVLAFIRSAGSLSPMLTDIEGGAQESRLVGGSQRVSELMAAELGDRVTLSAPIYAIGQHDDHLHISGFNTELEARRCIVAVPPMVADRIWFDPMLPGRRAQLQRRMAAGSVIKINAIYDEPFWRSDGLSGRIVNEAGPLTITFDNSPPDGSPGVLMGFLEADEARRLGVVPTADRRDVVLRCLAEHFGPKALTPSDYVEGNWDEEGWTRGCYGANLPPGAWTRYGAALREPIGLVHWASAETATRWMNYMDGAVESGQRAAGEVLAELP